MKEGNRMANYKPIAKYIPAASAVSGTIVLRNLSTTSWGLVLLMGSVIHKRLSGGESYLTVLRSGAVNVWENTVTTSTRAADRQTFTDAAGVYGITCKAGVNIIAKFFSN